MSESTVKQRKIVFGHKRALGDAIMFTAGVRNFKLLFPQIEIGVHTNFPEFFANNPYINRDLKSGDPDVEYYRVGYSAINNSNNSCVHFALAFLFDMIAMVDMHKALPLSLGEFCAAFANGRVGDPDLGVDNAQKKVVARDPFKSLRVKYGRVKDGGLAFLPIHLRGLFGMRDSFCTQFARQRGDIHMTTKEKEKNIIKEHYGVDKYWVIAPGGKRDCTTKMWDWRRFQKVIDYFEGKLKFVVIGRSDHLVEPLKGVISLVDKFNDNIRDMIPLVYHADGCVSGVSFLMHLAAAVPSRFASERKPCVAIYGGREPTSFTWYCNHQLLHTNGVFRCCDNGGCWHSRVVPLPKDPDKNKRLCTHPVMSNERTIPECMDLITADAVIEAISLYYQGDIYRYSQAPLAMCTVVDEAQTIGPPACQVELVKEPVPVKDAFDVDITTVIDTDKAPEINFLASLKSHGGGEQSACKIVALLRDAGWLVHFIPWANVHVNYSDAGVEDYSFKEGMLDNMREGLPLFFYANDQINDFCKEAMPVIEKSSSVAIGVNYVNGPLPRHDTIAKTGKLKAVIFQNIEKRNEFKRDAIGFQGTKLLCLYGAIDLNRFLEVCPLIRTPADPLVILKHCCPDFRKYVTTESKDGGAKIHLWQKHIIKEVDTRFYSRMLKDTKNTVFAFMEAHKEVVEYFKSEPRMTFFKWDQVPVTDFLARGHVYLYRTSNRWRDQYPRVVAEALAAGLPVLSEPRDGTQDRMDFGNIGFHCVDYDGFVYAIKLLQRKEKYRYEMGMAAKDWARQNLDPRKWVDILEEVFFA